MTINAPAPLDSTQQLAVELEALGHRTSYVPADGYWQLVPGVNVWSPHEPNDRYPVTTVLAPLPSLAPEWTWGDSFEHSAPRHTPDCSGRLPGQRRLPSPSRRTRRPHTTTTKRMNQREMEREIFKTLAAYFDGMAHSDLLDEVGIYPKTPAEEVRLSKAIEFVSYQLWRRARLIRHSPTPRLLPPLPTLPSHFSPTNNLTPSHTPR